MPEGQPNRITNPLQPIYKIPGHSEPTIDYKYDPFGEGGCSMSKANCNTNKQN